VAACLRAKAAWCAVAPVVSTSSITMVRRPFKASMFALRRLQPNPKAPSRLASRSALPRWGAVCAHICLPCRSVFVARKTRDFCPRVRFLSRNRSNFSIFTKTASMSPNTAPPYRPANSCSETFVIQAGVYVLRPAPVGGGFAGEAVGFVVVIVGLGEQSWSNMGPATTQLKGGVCPFSV